MPRQPRLVIPGVPLHITQRGNDRVRTFYSNRDYTHYLEILTEVSRDAGCAIHAWVLMPNHIHLLATPMEPKSASTMMRRVGVRFVRHINHTYGRTGTLWEGRFRSAIVTSDRYLLACARYIELNPQRSGLSADPATFRWSSYRHHAHGEADSLVTEHPLYEKLGDTPRARQLAWAAMCREALGEDVVEDIRKAVRATRARVDAREGTEFQHVAQRLGSGSSTQAPRLGSADSVP